MPGLCQCVDGDNNLGYVVTKVEFKWKKYPCITVEIATKIEH